MKRFLSMFLALVMIFGMHATVEIAGTSKLFMQGINVYEIVIDGNSKYKQLQKDAFLYRNALYVELDALLDGTGYSYYSIGPTYYIEKREKVIAKMSQSKYNSREDVSCSMTITDEAKHRLETSKDEAVIYLSQSGSSYYYTVIIPAAKQALTGNFYNGEMTWEGLAGEIIVGELPLVGTGADLRDFVADFENWKWSWGHVGQTVLDGVGCIPVIGAIKYTDEIAALARKSGKVLDADAVKATQKLLNKANNLDEVMDAAQGALKYSDEYVTAAKAAIKSAEDLKTLAKNPDIYADGVLEHIFYGNSHGGLHYNGLSGANGEVLEIIDEANEFGVYGANIWINGKKKYSTFFPDDWTPQQVLDAIDEAYKNGKVTSKKQIKYTLDTGINIEINLDESSKIRSAYPKYREGD